MRRLRDFRPGRKALQEADWGVFLVLALALFGIVNYLSYRYHHRFDLTASRSFSLSAQSRKVLNGLREPLDIVVFLPPGDELWPKVRDLLSAYESASPRVKVETIDPDRQRDRIQVLAKKYGVERANVVIFDVAGRSKFVEKDQMVDYDFSGMQMGMGPQVKGFKAEEAFTNAILDVLNPSKPTIYFTSGHGERPEAGERGEGTASFRSRLEKEGATLQEWKSLGQPSVPADASLVVVSGPQKPFDAHEADALGSYLDGGGKALILLDPMLGEGADPSFASSGLEGLLTRWGASPRKDLAIDPKGAVAYVGAQTFYALQPGYHPVVDDLRKNKLPVILTLACSLQTGTAPEGYKVDPLLSSSDGAWGETDLSKLEDVSAGDADTKGPLVLAAAVSSEKKEKPARLVVAGDSDLASDALLQAGGGNALFCMNAVHWLLSQESRIAIPPRTSVETKLDLTASQARFLFILFVVLIPGLVVLLGIRIYMRRRR